MVRRSLPIGRTVSRAAALFVSLLVLAPAFAATSVAAPSPWAVKANATCKTWRQKSAAVLGAHPTMPKTPAATYRFMQKARPIQVGELKALSAIRLPRPAAGTRALTYAAADIAELDAGLAAYRAGNQAKFLERAFASLTDTRAQRAFKALGAPACT
jgi:hypothetical protein